MALQEVGVKLVLDGGSFFSDLNRANDAVGQIGNKAKDSGGGFNALEQIAIGSLRKIGEAAITTGVQLAKGLAGSIAQSVQVAGDFEGAVNNLAAVSGTALQDAGFNFDDVSQKALQLGIDTRYSASESIAAMTELVKGGVPVSEVMAEATDNTLALAAAAGIELGPAAEIVAKQFGVWSDTGVTTAQVSDLITQAANASTVGVEDLALGLANAGGTAKTAGVEFDDLVQTMALIAPNFSSASDAGTSLKTFLSRLIPTTKPAKKAMYELGLYTEEAGSAFYDAQGNFIGMEHASALLQAATKDLSEEQRLLAFNTIFGADAIRAAAAIAEGGHQAFNDMGTAMANAGSAAEVAAIQNQGWNFVIDSLKGSIETLQITIGMLLLPILTPLVEKVSAVVNVFSSVIGAATGSRRAFDQLPASIQSFLAPFLGMESALSSGSDAVRDAATPFFDLKAVLAALPSPIATAITVIQDIIGVLSGDPEAMGRLPGTIQTIIEVAQGIPAALDMARQKLDEFFNTPLGTAIKDAASGFASYMLNNFGPDLESAVSTGRQKLDEFFNTPLGTMIKDSATGVANYFANDFVNDVSNGATASKNALEEFAASPWGIEIQQGAGVVADYFTNEWPGQLQRGIGVASLAFDGLAESEWWQRVQRGAGVVGDFMANEFPGRFQRGFERVKEWIDSGVRWLEDAATDYFTGANSIGANIVAGIIAGLDNASGGLFSKITNLVATALGKAKGAAEIKSPSRLFAREVGEPISQGIAVGILAGLPEVADAIDELAGETKDKAIKAFEGIGSAAAKMFDDALNGRLGLARTRQKALQDWGKFEDELADLRSKRGRAGEGEAAKAREEELDAIAALERQYADAETAEERAAISRDIRLAQDRVAAIDAEVAEKNAAIESDFQRLSARLVEAEKMRATAQTEAAEIAKVDAVAANDYLAMRENQINKILGLQAEQDGAETKQQQARANQMLLLEQQAQALELQQFKAAMDKRIKETEALGSDFEKTGISLIDGMIAGIQTRSSELSAALSAVMANALSTAQRQLGIASPSKLFAVEVGQPISEGIALGVNQAMPVALSAVSDMAAGLVRPAAPAVARGGNVSSSVTNQYYYSPNYNGAPRQPSQDFAAMRAFATAG